MDSETFEIKEFIQYRLNLTEANKKRVAEWKIAYTFREYYGVNKVDEKAVAKLAQEYNVIAS